MSDETARQALKDALENAAEGDEQPGVSPTAHQLTTMQLRDLAHEVLAQRDIHDRWTPVTRDQGLLFFEPLPHLA
jgi:hypothetical protein